MFRWSSELRGEEVVVVVRSRKTGYKYPNFLAALRELEIYPIGSEVIGASGQKIATRMPTAWVPKIPYKHKEFNRRGRRCAAFPVLESGWYDEFQKLFAKFNV